MLIDGIADPDGAMIPDLWIDDRSGFVDHPSCSVRGGGMNFEPMSRFDLPWGGPAALTTIAFACGPTGWRSGKAGRP